MSGLRRFAARSFGGRRTLATLLVFDVTAIVLATVAAYYARFLEVGGIPSVFSHRIPLVIGASVVLYVGAFALFGLYRLVLRHVGIDTMIRLGGASAIAFALLLVGDFLMPLKQGSRVAPVGVLLFQGALILLAASAIRLSVRVLSYIEHAQSPSGRKILIVGAGDAGSLLLRDIENQPDLGLRVVGFLDDAPHLQGRTIRSIPVVGTTNDVVDAVHELGAEEVMLALPTASQDVVRMVLNSAAEAGVKTRVMPKLVLDKGSVSLADLRKVEIDDLLGREPAPIDIEQVEGTIRGKVVAVTGAAGSIGSELCRQIMTLHPKKLLLLEIDESRLYELWLELRRSDGDVPVMRICDVRDPDKLEAIFAEEKPQVVLHAAAYKHVPLMEIEPPEAVHANVVGTRNVVEACVRHGVERFVLISTDKAVAPQSVMGATKAIAERVMVTASHDVPTTMVAVRFGNVLGSRGSVIPIFEEQLKRGGPITVTHPEVTRYFMTIPEAARLVLQAQAIGKSGDVFVLEMGEPVLIADLARKMIALSGVPTDIVYTGLRPAEKIHEVLVHGEETLEPTGCEKILRLSHPVEIVDGFPQLVEKLIGAADREDPESTVDALGELLPGLNERRAAEQAGRSEA